MKRVVSLLLATLLLVSMFSFAFADSGITPYASQVISETTAAIRFSGSTVYGGGQIKSVSTADQLGISSIVLYEKVNGSWTKIASAYSKYGYGVSNYSYSVSADATEGNEYKVTITFYGKIGSLTDTHTQSQTSTY